MLQILTPYQLPALPPLAATWASKKGIFLPSAVEEVAEQVTLEAFGSSKQKMNHI
jgi:hypothetical protein